MKSYIYAKSTMGVIGGQEYHPIHARNDEEAKKEAVRIFGAGGTLYGLHHVATL